MISQQESMTGHEKNPGEIFTIVSLSEEDYKSFREESVWGNIVDQVIERIFKCLRRDNKPLLCYVINDKGKVNKCFNVEEFNLKRDRHYIHKNIKFTVRAYGKHDKPIYSYHLEFAPDNYVDSYGYAILEDCVRDARIDIDFELALREKYDKKKVSMLETYRGYQILVESYDKGFYVRVKGAGYDDTEYRLRSEKEALYRGQAMVDEEIAYSEEDDLPEYDDDDYED